ncbi:MAG TPA: hypothetical protein PLS28_01895 [Clostridiales bacterium]|nr:hypothetical protein [Clostridiales bacterium]
MQPVFNPKITPACKYCSVGKLSPTGKEVLCVKRGIMLPDSSCKRFQYDPLKREPDRKPKLKKEYKEDDFRL